MLICSETCSQGGNAVLKSYLKIKLDWNNTKASWKGILSVVSDISALHMKDIFNIGNIQTFTFSHDCWRVTVLEDLNPVLFLNRWIGSTELVQKLLLLIWEGVWQQLFIFLGDPSSMGIDKKCLVSLSDSSSPDVQDALALWDLAAVSN